MIIQSLTREHLDPPQTRAPFRRVKLLVSGYLTVSAATFVAIVLLRDHTAVVDSAVWIRGTVVVASAAAMLMFTVRAARGSRRMYLRLRIVSAIMVVAIVVIAAMPGILPLWMRIEQGVCGAILIGVVALVNSRPVRSLFITR